MNVRIAALALAGVLSTGVARADSGIVVESYTGARPENAGRLLGPVLEELTTRGFAVGYDGVGRKFEREVSRPARTPDGLPGDFADRIERGHKAWIKGNFEDAIGVLTQAIRAAHGNAAVVSQDQKIRADVQRGLLDLALSHQRNGDAPAAEETMAELVRSFPMLKVTKASHGPDAFALYEATRKKLKDPGTLVVEVVDAATQVFLNEQYEKAGTVRRTDLPPGTYRVYAALGDREGRTYTVEVRAGAEAKLTIDIGLDSVLHVDPSWTGLGFTTAADREKLEAGYAAKFARLAHASAVAVVGVDTVRGRLALVGSLVSLDSGREIRRASLAIEPEPSSDRLRALARFLAGDDAARASLDVEDPAGGGTGDITGPGAGGDDRPRASGGSRWGVLKYLVAGVGLAAAGVGTYLLIKDGSCSSEVRPCPDLYEYTTPGWAAVGGGAALVGLGLYMFLTDDKKPERAVTVAPTDGGAMAFVRFGF